MLKPLAVALIGMLTVVPPAWAEEDPDSESLMDASDSSDDADADEDFADDNDASDESTTDLADEPQSGELANEADFVERDPSDAGAATDPAPPDPDALPAPPTLSVTPAAGVEDERAF